MKIVIKDEPKLYRETELVSFLNIAPRDPFGWKRAKEQLQGRVYWRQDLAELLARYNRSIGNDAAAMQKIEVLREEGSYCVITGQQLGLMGGPAYTVLKAMTCLLLAREVGAVPIFWLATEDHDLEEIDHTYLLDEKGNIEKFRLSLPKDGQSVEDLVLSPEHLVVIKKFCHAAGLSHLFDAFSGEINYARFMTRFLVHLFAGTGLVFVEPFLLRPLARGFFQREIVECDAYRETLQNTTEKLAKKTVPQLDVREGTNLFIKMEGKYRVKIIRKENAFFIGKQEYSEKELLDLIESEPERFSPNSAARTVLQSDLFPTLAYIAGPGELAYYHQLKDYHEAHQVPMPWIVPRLSATLITPRAEEMLEACRLKPWDEIPSDWTRVIPNLDAGLKDLATEWLESGMKHVNLPSEMLACFIGHQIEKLQRKVHRIRLRRQGVLPYSLHYLKNFLHPHEMLQERVFNWWQFQGKDSLIHAFLKEVKWKTEGHIYCFLK